MANIVLAEDDLHIVKVVGLWLRRNHHEVVEVINGRDALEAVKEHRPDLLITDVNMPAVSGVDLVKACASEGVLPHGVIIMSSRCDQAEIRHRLRGLSVVLHPKPFSPSKLIHEAESLLERAVEARAPSSTAKG
jgi:DNA-binding response OmpR family regulator